MKKVLSSILISFIIFANLLAPFSVGFDKNKIEINKNEVRAENSIIPISVNSYSPIIRKTYVGINGIFSSTEKIDVKDLLVEYFISDNANEVTTSTIRTESQTGDAFKIYTRTIGDQIYYDYWFGKQIEEFSNQKGTFDFKDDKEYYVYIRAIRINLKEPVNGNSAIQIGESKVEKFIGGVLSETGQYAITDEQKAKVLAIKKEILENGGTEEEAVLASQKIENEKDILYKKENNSDNMPACNPLNGALLSGDGTIMGCIAQAFYYVLFVPTSYLFALSGTFFDSTFAYSVQDTSYRSSFVVEGWGLVRDFCNMFFIFILLYVAISTVLSIHGFKTKETIINVVIIGLFINFSLFATQVIIDASNVTARVFYNSDAIKVTEKGQTDNTLTNALDGGTIIAEEGSTGVIRLSEALVNKVNPQNLILHSKEINNIPDKGGVKDTNKDPNLDAGSFILITILASAINIVGLIVFLSVGLMFVSRVIGLWLAMIMAPLAFFTYILPEQMAGIKMIGWKNWWPETIKLAFLAPVFIFFMYIILKFLELDLIADVSNKTFSEDGLGFFVATIIPFAFIMILMMKAKSIASDMSGELGKQITGGVAAAGGMLLGGAALGTAFLARRTIGAGMAKISRGDTATQKYELAKHAMSAAGGRDTSFMRNLSTWDKIKGSAGSALGFGKIYGQTDGTFNVATGQRDLSIKSGVGGLLNKTQKDTNDVDRARHHSDEDMEKAGFKGMKWTELSGEQQNIVKENVKKTNYTKFTDDAERDVRRTVRKDTVDPLTGKLADLNSAEKEQVKNRAKEIAVEHFTDDIKSASKGVNAFSRILSKANTGSYDIRKLSEIETDKRASIFSKIPVGLIAGVATGVRAGILKSSGLSNGGVKVEANFMDDLKSVIGDSLKSVKVSIPETHSGGDTKKVGHGDGGGHH